MAQGSGLVAGGLLIEGDAGPAVGYAQKGGTIVVAGSSGPRAGLNQGGGVLILLGPVGPLAGERQSGGLLFFRADQPCLHASRGQTGGRFVAIPASSEPPGDDHEIAAFSAALERFKIRPESI